jgi:hypothetical protein
LELKEFKKINFTKGALDVKNNTKKADVFNILQIKPFAYKGI